MDNPNDYTPEQMLLEVRKAKRAVLIGGQSYTIGSRSLTRADLRELNKMEQELMGELANAQQSSLINDAYVAVFDSR